MHNDNDNKHAKHLVGLDGVAAELPDAAAAFERFLDTFGFVGGGAAVSAAGTS